MKEALRKAAFSGSWYSDNQEVLSNQIQQYLDNAEYQNLNVKAIIVPHAGYMFSGQTAAHSFKQLNRDTKKVIILGTAHRYPLKGACVINYDYYDSPLGKVKVSDDAADILKESNVFNIPEADSDEHSIEIEIPFLKKVLKDFEILPVIVGQVDFKQFSSILEKYFTKDSAIVASVDLSHFHKYSDAVKIDTHTINCILQLDLNGLKKSDIDSPYAVAALIELAKRKNWKTILLDYKNSGDIISDRSSVVGYSAIVFYDDNNEEYFSKEEKDLMVNIARNTVRMYVKSGKVYSEENPISKFNERLACFVTIKTGEELRGCIGTIEPVDTLYNSIIENAISAATRDPRFSPMAENELEGLNYEVSVLSPPKLFEPKSSDELLKEIKDKGLIIKKDFRSAVYLPQVWEQLQDEKDFLTSLCRKAGLHKDEWKNYKSMKFYLFNLI